MRSFSPYIIDFSSETDLLGSQRAKILYSHGAVTQITQYELMKNTTVSLIASFVRSIA